MDFNHYWELSKEAPCVQSTHCEVERLVQSTVVFFIKYAIHQDNISNSEKEHKIPKPIS